MKKGLVEPGTSMFDYIQTIPEYASKPEIVNDLMDRFSKDTRRLEVPRLHSIFDTIKQARALEL